MRISKNMKIKRFVEKMRTNTKRLKTDQTLLKSSLGSNYHGPRKFMENSQIRAEASRLVIGGFDDNDSESDRVDKIKQAMQQCNVNEKYLLDVYHWSRNGQWLKRVAFATFANPQYAAWMREKITEANRLDRKKSPLWASPVLTDPARAAEDTWEAVVKSCESYNKSLGSTYEVLKNKRERCMFRSDSKVWVAHCVKEPTNYNIFINPEWCKVEDRKQIMEGIQDAISAKLKVGTSGGKYDNWYYSVFILMKDPKYFEDKKKKWEEAGNKGKGKGKSKVGHNISTAVKSVKNVRHLKKKKHHKIFNSAPNALRRAKRRTRAKEESRRIAKIEGTFAGGRENASLSKLKNETVNKFISKKLKLGQDIGARAAQPDGGCEAVMRMLLMHTETGPTRVRSIVDVLQKHDVDMGRLVPGAPRNCRLL